MHELALKNWAEQILLKIERKMLVTNQRQQNKIPYKAENGSYDDLSASHVSWWTNGFFAGSLWQMYANFGNVEYKDNAINVEKMLDRALDDFEDLHHDVGFMWLHTAVANYRLNKDSKSRSRGLHAANLLLSRFNIKGQYLVAWNCDVPGWAIIDSMMNIPILYWAFEETGDFRFKHVAMAHADTLSKYLIRQDGSVGHIASFNSKTGEFIEQIRGQGYSSDSSWTRGQAWAIYGYILSYKYTNKKEYLDIAKRVANYFIANVSQTNFVSLVDFRCPIGINKLDTSATACAACGILELSNHVEESEKEYYKSSAVKMIRTLTDKFVDFDLNRDGILLGSSHSYHQVDETEINFVYGDYFFIEGVLKLLNKDFNIW